MNKKMNAIYKQTLFYSLKIKLKENLHRQKHMNKTFKNLAIV